MDINTGQNIIVHCFTMFLQIPSKTMFFFVLTSLLNTLNAQRSDNLKVVIEGEHISLMCHLISSLDTLVWKSNDDVIATYNEGTVIDYKKFSLTVNLNRSISTLVKNQTKFEDAGNYSCIQYPKYDTQDVETHDVTLMVQGMPILSVDKDTFKEGEPIFATCCVNYTSGLMDISNITLSIGNDNLELRISLSPDRTTKDNITSLCQSSIFQSKRNFHNKFLIFRAFDQSNTFSSVRILVLYLPVVTIYPALKQWQVNEGEEANVICEANGNPIPEVYLQQKVSSSSDWTTFYIESNTYQDSETNYKGLNVTLKINTGSLGFYRCMATNDIGSSFSDVNFLYAQGPDTIAWERPAIITCVILIAFLTGAVTCKNRRQRSKRIKKKNVDHLKQLADRSGSYPVSVTNRMRSPCPSRLDTSHQSVDVGKNSSTVKDEGYIDIERSNEPVYSSYITNRGPLDNDKRNKVHR
ncbi:cell adhesion molecule 2-like [Apostichopus japonicus]|uniref:cell adhesion molecule 2-like n=1 Tax=Stichopus japonicus TaxID=307972 RepID=UPI003AB7CA25